MCRECQWGLNCGSSGSHWSFTVSRTSQIRSISVSKGGYLAKFGFLFAIPAVLVWNQESESWILTEPINPLANGENYGVTMRRSGEFSETPMCDRGAKTHNVQVNLDDAARYRFSTYSLRVLPDQGPDREAV